jgi:hypothetical protein
VDTGAA